MPLFHPRIIKKNQLRIDPLTDEQREILERWSSNLTIGNYDIETQSDSEFIQQILVGVLGYSTSSSGTSWSVSKNIPAGDGNVDVALGRFSSSEKDQVIAPFELKGARTKDLDAIMPGRNKSPIQQAWEYAMDIPGSQWVIVSNMREIRLYAFGYGRKDYEVFNLETILEEKTQRKFRLLMSADSILTGVTSKLLKQSEETEKEVTEKLYDDYKAVRVRLINEIIENAAVGGEKAIQTGQTILDRFLFTAFCEDKGLLNKNTLKETAAFRNPYKSQPIWQNFVVLFQSIDRGNKDLKIPGYNGGLFAQNDTIDELVISNELCQSMADLGEYDFESDVSVNILGHIFEQSIADLEELKAFVSSAREVKPEPASKRQTDGIFYTPQFITRHIVEQTVGKWLNDRKEELGFSEVEALIEDDYQSINVIKSGKSKGRISFNANIKKHVKLWEDYRDCVQSIRVLDPACGSGAFLNEVFDYLCREGQIINRQLEAFYGDQISLFKWEPYILANNIFGVDINAESVGITKLSLWLKTANRNEKLSYLDDSIRVGNSLVNDPEIDPSNAFDWEKTFSKILKKGGFDVVLGNPPYVDSETMTKSKPEERKFISNSFSFAKGNWDLYVAFIEKGLSLLSNKGYMAYITPDKWISKKFGLEIRKHILPDLSAILPLGRGVFDGALVDSIVTTISAKGTDEVEVLSVENGEIEVVSAVPKEKINIETGFDELLSPNYELIRKIEGANSVPLIDYAECENACATNDAYTLTQFIRDAESGKPYDIRKDYKVANTGTLNRYTFKWGRKPMRYIKADYLFPAVKKKDFDKVFGATYRRRARSPKLIIKGLTLLDAAIDVDASYVPGKSTLVIPSEDPEILKFLAGMINSKLSSFYIKQKYASSSYNTGVNFTTDMINSIPIPLTVSRKKIASTVSKIVKASENIENETNKIISTIRSISKEYKYNSRIEHWYALELNEFIKVVERCGAKLKVKERSQWVDLFEKSRGKIAQDLDISERSQNKIDDLVFSAFNLSDKAREIIQNSH